MRRHRIQRSGDEVAYRLVSCNVPVKLLQEAFWSINSFLAKYALPRSNNLLEKSADIVHL